MTIATRGQELPADASESNQTTTTAGVVPDNTPPAEEIQDTTTIIEPVFPHDKLASLDEKISNIRWVVPVLADQELESLLRVSIELCKAGTDIKSSACQRFFREGLTISFTKILTDDAVSSWKPNIHVCINQNCLRLVELCVIKLSQDWFPLLDLLAMVLNPNCKFHTFNAARQSDSALNGVSLDDEDLYARCLGDLRNARGWLVDLINKFGELGGFLMLLERFQSGQNLTVAIVYALLRPFGLCYEYLTANTINKYLLPVLEIVPSILDKLTDDELKREAKNETKSDIVSAIIKSSKNLASRVANQEELIRTLEGFRLKMILRQLQISSFNGKMNALNEINKVISSVSYYPNRHHGVEEEEYLTPERMATWINENQVLEIVLRDSLHQPQYVEKLEKILRFVIKERRLTLGDLDAVWSAQAGKHEAIVKNVHDLLAKLAWDFSADQLDHLFGCFQASWTSASRRQRERLLELIRRLAEDDKDGVMAYKVLTLFWNLAHSEDAPTEMMDQALAAHVKILDYSCSQERDAQKTTWLDKCVEELKSSDKWVLPALKQIREICCLYEPSPNGGLIHPQRGGGGGGPSTSSNTGGPTPTSGGGGGGGSHQQHMFYRQEVIERLQSQHSLVVLVTNSLTGYMDRLRQLVRVEGGELTADGYVPDGRYPHHGQVQERLNFLRFLLKDGQLWLCAEQAKQIWQCLAENAVFASDREACFKWFAKLMGEEPDLDPGINRDFFEQHILQCDQSLLTESGIRCFERFFKAVNTKAGKLRERRRCRLVTEDPDLIGLDYLWRVVTVCSDEIATRAIELLREVSTNLGPRLAGAQLEFHENYITECYDRLRAHYDTILALQRSCVVTTDINLLSSPSSAAAAAVTIPLAAFNNITTTTTAATIGILPDQQLLQQRIRAEAVKVCRVMHVLHEYVSECDSNYTGEERKVLPLHRACRGKHMALVVRFSSPNRQVDDIEIFTHSNDTLAALRKSVLRKIKSSEHFKVELYVNGESLDFANDHKLLAHLPIRDKMIISAKVSQINLNMASSQDSSSDSSTSSPQHPYDCPPPTSSTLPSTIPAEPPISNPNHTTITNPNHTTTTITAPVASNNTHTPVATTTTITAPDPEQLLPGVIMSMQPAYAAFFCRLAALGARLGYAPLREGARALLQLMPCDTATIERLLRVFTGQVGVSGGGSVGRQVEIGGEVVMVRELSVDSMFFSATPSEVLYNLEVLYAQLMPAIDPLSDKSYRIQYSFLVSGEAHTFLEMFTRNNFMSGADTATRRSAYLVVLRVCKVILTAVAHVLVRLAEDHTPPVDPDHHLYHGQRYHQEEGGATRESMTPGMYLRQALRFVPCPSDHIVRQVSVKLSQGLADLMLSTPTPPTTTTSSPPPTGAQALFSLALNWELPDLATVLALVRLIWAASSANLQQQQQQSQSSTVNGDQLHSLCDPGKRNAPLELHLDDVLLCREALEVLSVSLVLNPGSLVELCKVGGELEDGGLEKGGGLCNLKFTLFVTDMVLLNPSRSVRVAAAEQFIMICNYGAASRTALQLIGPLLFSLLDTLVLENAKTSHEFFQLLCRLVNASFMTGSPLPQPKTLLANEVNWLRQARSNSHELLLEGHLLLTRELLYFISAEQKCELGSSDCGSLIRELVEDFLFPASKLALQLQRVGQLVGEDPATPICETPQTQAAAFDLLLALCMNCTPNFRQLVRMLTEMFYTDQETAILEWDYLPTVGPRPLQGFVGLKNAGATCYMNSVLQQLYMVTSIREGLLACEGAANDPNEDFSGEDRAGSGVTCATSVSDHQQQLDVVDGDESTSREVKIAMDYNVGILKQVQAIFGHLACSRLQYYVPRGLWRHFKLQGEPVNLREQQDAVEFFMALVESLDEALKLLGLEQIMSKILGGSYSDQKICKGCPHRYSKEEPFSVISVDIRNHSSLQDSMEQYVKGELLEGADAYHCEKCAKKVVTVKRLCVKKLPPVLGIQLKRFEYDFERVCAIKFNDYFEFPRHLDMEPYTVSGLARLEGEVIDCDLDQNATADVCTKYQLTGIVVHSGQASGGHYYSYIRSRDSRLCHPTTLTTPIPSTTTSSNQSGQSPSDCHWYKFDDGEVTECRMSDDEDMKVQCFGGDYMAEVFDPVLKRTTYRRQKRWWNAYMLFYTRLDVEQADIAGEMEKLRLNEKKKETHLKMPVAIEHSIRKQNIKFLHHRNQFSMEYFNFIRKLVTSNPPAVLGNRQSSAAAMLLSTGAGSYTEQFGMLSTQLAARFLFHTGWHTKKNLRGPAMEWCDILCLQLRTSASTRAWFATHMLFAHPHRFCEYLLSCPSNEVRMAFMKIVVLLAHFSIGDPCPAEMATLPVAVTAPSIDNSVTAAATAVGVTAAATLSDHILLALLGLLQREVSDHGRHLSHYCNVFHMYAGQGLQEKEQLLKLNVPATFMLVALDEGPGPVIKYQYTELGKLNQVVTCLVRCCDVSSKCQSSTPGGAVLPNPHREPTCPGYIMPLSPQAGDILFNRTSYIKKVIEDSNIPEESVKLLQFCSWENPHFSRTVLSELLWQIAYAYCQELRHHMDLLLAVLLLEDSWQSHRIHNAIKGVPDERDGLLETIIRSKNNYQKRAYQCVKCLVALFSKSRTAMLLLHDQPDIRRQWGYAVAWLQDELERRYPNNSQYSYNSWSPPAQSNENSNGYVLERSNSARKTLERAMEMLPDPPISTTTPTVATTIITTTTSNTLTKPAVTTTTTVITTPQTTPAVTVTAQPPPPPPPVTTTTAVKQQQHDFDLYESEDIVPEETVPSTIITTSLVDCVEQPTAATTGGDNNVVVGGDDMEVVTDEKVEEKETTGGGVGGGSDLPDLMQIWENNS